MTKHIQHETGTIQLNNRLVLFSIARSSKRKRTIAIKFQESKGLIILAPFHVDTKQLHQVINQRSEWILQQLDHFNSRQSLLCARKLQAGEKILYLGKTYTLQIEMILTAQQACILVGNTLTIMLHARNSEAVRFTQVKNLLIKWYRQQALDIIQQRILDWQFKLGVTPTKISITNASTRWGSCNHMNKICFSWKLILTPLELIDYVIVHELCHIVHKNHSKSFWKLVASVMPDYKEKRKKLRLQDLDIFSLMK